MGSYEVRKNLLTSELKSEYNKEALLYFLSCAILDVDSLKESVGKRFVKDDPLFSRISFLCSKVIGNKQMLIHGNIVDFRFVAEYFQDKNYGSLCEMEKFVNTDDAYKSCIRSFFEVYGHVSDVNSTERYVEIYFKRKEVGDSYGKLLSKMNISYGTVRRNKNYVLYIKKFESICDYLAIIGAMSYAINFQVAKADIEMQTQIKRTCTLDLVNIEKTRKNGIKEVNIIQEIIKKKGRESIPENLIQLCDLRLQNPEANYQELADLHIPKMSKGSVSIKMKKIAEILNT